VDWHTHVWLPEHLGDFGRELGSRSGLEYAAMGAYADHERCLDEAGASHAIVLALQSRHLEFEVPNEYVAEYVHKHPTRLVGFACVDPNDDHAPAKVREAARVLGMRGLKLSPPYQSFHPHSDAAFAVYKAATAENMVLMFHQGAVFARRGVLEVASPTLLDRVARTFPETRIIIAHAGQPWFDEVVPLLNKHPNVYADISARTSHPWQMYHILQAAIDYRVQRKLLFGSDFPVISTKVAHQQLRALTTAGPAGLDPIPEEVVEEICGHSLSDLGLEPAVT
jgi:predicted TIM-barrel fold metal-dependent hydrolase